MVGVFPGTPVFLGVLATRRGSTLLYPPPFTDVVLSTNEAVKESEMFQQVCYSQVVVCSHLVYTLHPQLSAGNTQLNQLLAKLKDHKNVVEKDLKR